MKKSSLRWAWKTFILSISLSIVFSVVSQGLFPKLPAFISVFIILFFIFVSVVFDMVGIAVASLNPKILDKFKDEKGYNTALTLCKNTDKVSSFCGDVVGDICGILSGAGGVSLVLNMHIFDMNIYFLITCLISSLIAGLTIFGKAIMKGFAVERAEVVVMKTGKMIESVFSFKEIFKKKKNSQENNKFKK